MRKSRNIDSDLYQQQVKPKTNFQAFKRDIK
jgi:hypothetical protein